MKKKSNILIKFGKRVKEERLRRGLSQEDLADLAGVHRTYIGMIERAEKNITLENIERITNALQIKISDIFTNYES
ncbi:MAG: helix-turn-helix transcriptional regulator [Tissierellales bacterium]|nr:helix-turn-helix transcriptional regulator [Tissierellales bacterium]